MSREREGVSALIAWVERSETREQRIRERRLPDFAPLNPGYRRRSRGRPKSRPAKRLQHPLLRLRRLGVISIFRLILERLCQHRQKLFERRVVVAVDGGVGDR